MRGKQEPPRRARSGAPTCSHPHGCQRQQRVGLRALSPSEHLPKCAKERPRESFDAPRLYNQLSPGKSIKGFDFVSTRPNHWKHTNAVPGSILRQSGCPLPSRMRTHRPSEATENHGTGLGSSQVRPKDLPLRSQVHQQQQLEAGHMHMHVHTPTSHHPRTLRSSNLET